MRGNIISINDDHSDVILGICIAYPKFSMDLDVLDVVERRKVKMSTEYQRYLSSLENFSSRIFLGEIEISYIGEVCESKK